jgi:very-short-patch-repair endonuclease
MHQVAGVSFRRQHAIGPYIVDFCAPRHKLVIEVDGGQHLEQEAYDLQRTAFLEGKGYRVLRFWNNEVMEQLDAILAVVWEALNPTPSQPPPKIQRRNF